MAVTKSGEEPFKPYARLISILGDQLISDKWIGVIELVKNCYDADAEKVFVRFNNFDVPGAIPSIEIEDDGDGMSLKTLLDVYMKPATPHKLNKKKAGELRFTKKKRVMQGDKGVGRFAIYKLGSHVELYTKTVESNEIKLNLDFAEYANDEFVETDHKDKFLDEIMNTWEERDTPQVIKNKKNQGTILRIFNPKNPWKEQDIYVLLKAFFRMMPPTLPGQEKVAKDFEVKVFWNDVEKKGDFKTFEEIVSLAPFYFEGLVDFDGTLDFTYKHNKRVKSKKFNFFDDEEPIAEYNIWSLKFFKEVFLSVYDKSKKATKDNFYVLKRPKVGRFMFYFFAFDWKNPIEGLKEDEKKFLQENSVYLYRDNVRVFPYGERGIDWLMLSKYRAEDKAGFYFSYNDLIGFVFISQDENSKLRDAADREGLMNIEGAYDEFVALIQASLKVMKDEVEIDKGKALLQKQVAVKTLNHQFESSFVALQNKISAYDDKELIDVARKFFNSTNSLITKVKEDLKITQELAGTGMAVEKATHDTMTLIKKLKENTGSFVERMKANSISPKELEDFLIEIQESLEFLYQELQVLQPLFRVARKVTRDVSVKNVADRVIKYFRNEIINNIDVNINCDTDIIVKTNTGLILQVLLNLMDNSIYWLDQVSVSNKKIEILVDGENDRIVFADNGPGIPPDIIDLIFTEFYSKKDEGRGLGLYIAKELLDRIDARISVIQEPQLKLLSGANFLIQFNKL